MKSSFETDFIDGIRALKEHGILTSPWRVESSFALGDSRDGWMRPAQMFSMNVQGSVFPSKDGFTWCPTNKHQFYLKEHKSYEAIIQSRSVVEQLGQKAGYSVPQLARACIKFVVAGTKAPPFTNPFLQDIKLGYHDCVPGQFNYAELWDVKGCYYNLLRALPSLRLSVHGNELDFTGTPSEEWQRWRHVLEVVKDAKALRNTMWGTMLGTIDNRPVVSFCRGKRNTGGVFKGHYHRIAALVGRSAWELCRDEAEVTSAIYSQTDCVATLGRKPKIWTAHNLPIELKARGEAEYCRRGCYCPNLRAPESATEWYSKGSRFYEPAPRAQRKEVVYYEQWLR